VEALPTGAEGDNYVKITEKHFDEEESEGEGKEGEEKND